VSIGWPTGNPFQTEVAVANLAIGVLGILCYWFRDNFWLATVIGNAVWQLGDAVIHIRQIVVANNWAPNNAGVTLYTDIAIPIVLIVLLAIARRHAPDRAAHRRLAHQPRLDDEVARHRRSGRVYRELVGDCRGAVANCIPELEVVDPDSFAICLSTCDGRN
jgi:hypothetical protein